MIKIGNILINPEGIDTILQIKKDSSSNCQIIQIIYKSGVVKNISSEELGLSYDKFIEEFINTSIKTEDKKLLKLIAALKQNG